MKPRAFLTLLSDAGGNDRPRLRAGAGELLAMIPVIFCFQYSGVGGAA